MAETLSLSGLEREVESALRRAWPNMSEHDLGMVHDDIATLCRVLREQQDLLRPLVAFKRAFDRNRPSYPTAGPRGKRV